MRNIDSETLVSDLTEILVKYKEDGDEEMQKIVAAFINIIEARPTSLDLNSILAKLKQLELMHRVSGHSTEIFTEIQNILNTAISQSDDTDRCEYCDSNSKYICPAGAIKIRQGPEGIDKIMIALHFCKAYVMLSTGRPVFSCPNCGHVFTNDEYDSDMI